MPPRSSREVLGRLPAPMPGPLAARVGSWRADPQVVDPVPAATVVLLRDGAAGPETYLLHRHARMPFAPGMVVFPGGRVDPADGAGPLDERWRTCAVRETREETGVVLEAADLVDWAHWVTPAFEPRRYDTRFYLAALPAGQHAEDVSGETTRADWRTPAGALADAEAGTLELMPPTRSVLTELTAFASVSAALHAGRDRTVEPVLPVAVQVDGIWCFRYPAPGTPDGDPGA